MKKEKILTVCTLGMIACIIVFCSVSGLMVKSGYARDAGIYVWKWVEAGLWVLFFGAIIALAAFAVLPKLKREKAALILSSGLLIVVITYGLLIHIGWNLSFKPQQEIDFSNGELHAAALDMAEEMRFNR